MKVVVKIDRDSIVRNNNAGDTETNIFLGAQEVPQDDGTLKTVSLYRSAKHPAIPEYSFSYMVTKAKCCHCHESVEVSDLGYDSEYDRDGGKLRSSETICPACDKWDCCDLTFEAIEDLVAPNSERVG